MLLKFMTELPVLQNDLFLYLDDRGADQLIEAINAARRVGQAEVQESNGTSNVVPLRPGSKNSFGRVAITFDG